MARVTVEDCLEREGDRFELIRLATERARQLMMTHADPLVAAERDTPPVLALREIAAGLVTRENVSRLAFGREEDEMVIDIPTEEISLAATLPTANQATAAEPVPAPVESITLAAVQALDTATQAAPAAKADDSSDESSLPQPGATDGDNNEI